MTKPSGDRSWLRPMRSRDPQQQHRAATPLELFFDLCFVVAIALAASKLHHGLAHGEVAESLKAYTLVFFAIWWAWMGLTWFASAYDTDDVPYRIKVFVQMSGVLILAAGVPRAFDHQDFGVITFGYCVMRVALVAQWLRAAREDRARRRTALRYAVGISACQVGWVALLLAPGPLWFVGWCILVFAELLVPIFAERAEPTQWHPHHIAERYGLLTLIVLGETVLAATIAIQSALDAHALSPALVGAVVGGLLILFSMWWLYFSEPAGRLLTSTRVTFQWGYAHLLIFASVAAVGAGLALYVDFVTGEAHLTQRAASAPLAGAATIFVLLVWWLHQRPARRDNVATTAYVLAAGGLLAACWSSWPVLVAGLVLAALVAVQVWRDAAASPTVE